MKRKIDLMTVLGLLFCLGFMVFGIVLNENKTTGTAEVVFGNINAFIHIPSIIITMGGTFTTLMIMFPFSQIVKIPKHIKIIFMPKQYNPEKYINILVEEAKKARINGLLSLEADLEGMDDAFLKKSIQMLVDGVDAEEVKVQLESALDNLDERHALDRSFYDKGAALGPAFGMIGTLIGLINMLKTLEDVSTVGPNMATALITTFYGSLIANVIFAPISNKLKVRHEEEYLCMKIVCEGAQAIQAGANPNILQDKLLNMLPEYQKKKLFGKMPKSDDTRETGQRRN